MALPWVRLDSNIASHDKIMHLLSDPSPKKWQATTVYMFALGWSGGHGTDGEIPAVALSMVHGNPAVARLLVKYHLWEETLTGYVMPNFPIRQELEIVTEAKRFAQKAGGLKGACIRHHGPDCGCWKQSMDGGLSV
jgi:hypothetical protein